MRLPLLIYSITYHTSFKVDVSFDEMNKADCFILDAGKLVYVYCGPNSRRMERMKAIMTANGIRDDDHAGGAKIVIIGVFDIFIWHIDTNDNFVDNILDFITYITYTNFADETADGGEVGQFLEAMGGGSLDDIPDEETLDDSEHERSQEVKRKFTYCNLINAYHYL